MMERKTIQKWTVAFFGGMALFTVLSRAAYQQGTAVIHTAAPSSGTVSHPVRLTGKAVQTQEIAVTTLPGLRVGAVLGISLLAALWPRNVIRQMDAFRPNWRSGLYVLVLAAGFWLAYRVQRSGRLAYLAGILVILAGLYGAALILFTLAPPDFPIFMEMS